MSDWSKLSKKYDVPAPRYTSYPTVPYWENTPTTDQWVSDLQKTFDKPQTDYSVYIHIPYCETLCTFCGCNTVITKDHKKEEPYIDLVLKEWNKYLELVPQIKNAKFCELHLGGGTPTFLSPESLKRLLKPILETTNEKPECSIEVDPRRTSIEQLSALRELGFQRVSLGVQDFNPEVQRLVNRVQPFEMTAHIAKASRDLGYKSVNFDLIYGLPKQTEESIKHTIELALELRPDRVALYSYAHVPWIKPAQRLFTEEDLPQGDSKRKLYEVAREMFLKAGYQEIGMDHFALPTDSLFKALEAGHLHRNFMGYTHRRTQVLLGLGVSSISETPTCFHQNEKVLPVYERMIQEGKLATHRGHLLTSEDQKRREQILKLMTTWQTDLEPEQYNQFSEMLSPMIEDGLVDLTEKKLRLNPQGKPFLRNACMVFDERLRAKIPQTEIFSRSL